MPLAPGTQLGPYEITAPLGAGGMGEVYRARDTRLGRDVAVKVLPQHLSSDPDLKARFEREARTISALSHPHVCHLYDVGSQDGTDYLVMELLEGESLADRLKKGPLPLKQALQYGIEVADALEIAHNHGIVHRDLKPGNVMLTKSGAKLLDFGLAKPKVGVVGAVGSSSSGKLEPSTPTMSIAVLSTPAPELTQQGMVVGTFQYMAPEVLQGQETDARSDIFALGAVLYEMISGKRAFEGKSQLSVMTAILEKEPERMPQAPPALEHVVQTCLAKDPAERWQSAGQVVRELQWATQSSSTAPAVGSTPAAKKWLQWTMWGVFALAAVWGVFAAIYFGSGKQPTRVLRVYIPPPEKARFAFASDVAGPVVIAPDGGAIAFVADDDAEGKHLLWIRELNADHARPLAGTDGATFPFWSWDSHMLGFFSDGKLKTIATVGGTPIPLCDAPQGRGGAWNRDGVIVFAPMFQGGLYRVAATAGTPVQTTKIDSTRHDSHRWPVFLPDGKHFLFLAVTHRALSDPTDAIYLGSLDGSQQRLVMSSTANVVFRQGRLLFLRGDQLLAQEFDAARGVLLGSAVKIADDVQNDPTTWHGSFDASENGILIHGTGGGAEAQLKWFDRTGKLLGTVGKPEISLLNLRLSPQGDQVATEASSDIWIYDLTRNVRTRLTFNGQNQNPVWSPDGKWVGFLAFTDLMRKSADGSGESEVLFKGSTNKTTNDWSRDGKFLLYTEGLSGNGQNVWALPVDGDRKPMAVTTRKEGVDQSDAAFSPDGRWVSYSSTESGRNEVYIVPFEHGGGRWQVSTAGGDGSRWSPDGKELFYLALDRTLMAAPVFLGKESVRLGIPQPLFRTSVVAPNLSLFDVSAGGQRFLVGSTIEQQSAPLSLMVNWTEELKK